MQTPVFPELAKTAEFRPFRTFSFFTNFLLGFNGPYARNRMTLCGY